MIKIEDGKPVGNPMLVGDFHQLFPNVSLVWPVLTEHLSPFGYAVYDFWPKPEHGTFEVAEEISPTLHEDGVWRQTFSVREMTEEERVQRIEIEWDEVRSRRNFLLSRCDWTQLPDAPLSNTETADWGSYRQILRDITNQSDPFNIEWPVSPGA